MKDKCEKEVRKKECERGGMIALFMLLLFVRRCDIIEPYNFINEMCI